MSGVAFRTRLAYNDKTGMFEEVPLVGRRLSGVLRILSWPFRKTWSLLCWAVKILFSPLIWFFCFVINCCKVIWRKCREGAHILASLSRPFKKARDLSCQALGVLFMLLIWFFHPAIKWWKVVRRNYREGEYLLVALWLVPGYLLFLIYRGLILWVLGAAWHLVAAIVGFLWRGLISIFVCVWDFCSSLLAMAMNMMPMN